MIARGWKSLGTADGGFGPKTEDVVRRFQRTCRVGVDGQIGPKTWPLPWARPLG
jgi:peptidoglycan hydrolase-like protein with peptidoglycan-binding domain